MKSSSDNNSPLALTCVSPIEIRILAHAVTYNPAAGIHHAKRYRVRMYIYRSVEALSETGFASGSEYIIYFTKYINEAACSETRIAPAVYYRRKRSRPAAGRSAGKVVGTPRSKLKVRRRNGAKKGRESEIKPGMMRYHGISYRTRVSAGIRG